MKKLIFVFLVALLVSACQSPTATQLQPDSKPDLSTYVVATD